MSFGSAGKTLIDPPKETLTFATKMPVARTIWWGLVVLCIVLLLAALPTRFNQLRTLDSGSLYALNAETAAILFQYQITPDAYAVYVLVFEVIQTVGFWAIAFWLFFRRPHDPMVIFTAITLMMVGGTLPAPMSSLRPVAPLQIILNILSAMAYVLTMVFVYVYPTGRFVPRQVRWLSRIGVMAILVLLFAFNGDLRQFPPLLQTGLTILWLGPALVSQWFRYRQVATDDQRQQIRWFTFGVMTLIVGAFIRGIFGLFIPQASTTAQLLYTTLIAVPLLDTAVFLIFPLCLAVALARYRLYGLTLIVNRSLISALVLGMLLIAFGLSFVAIQSIVTVLNGSPAIAVMIATFVTTALFNPVRRWVRHQVDVHVFRLRLDLNQIADQERERKNPQPPDTGLVGQTIDAYELQGLIGQGGMGQVYRAADHAGNKVAIKFLPDVWLSDDTMRARFDREARVLMQIQHPQVVRVYAADSKAEHPYIVMEYIDGVELGDYLQKQGRLSLEQTRTIIRQIAEALAAIHAVGVVHRDVKPSNVMLRAPDERPVLMDFGIALETSGKTRLTQSGFVGTLSYIAPEQIMQNQLITPQADQYALAAMTYQLLTGHTPFYGSVAEVVFAHLQEPPPDARLFVTGLPPETAHAIQRAMQKSPAQRFEGVTDFALAL